jgi:PAS domain S-box-containing protein
MWIYDTASLRFLEVNEAAVRRYGWSRDEFLAMTVRDIRPEEDVPRLLRFLEGKPGEGTEDRVWRHLRKSGELIYVESISHPLQWEGRRAQVVLVNDVTERVQVEEEMRETLAELNTLHQAAPVGIALVSSRTLLRGNQALSGISGYAREDLMLLPAERLFASGAEAARFFDVAEPQLASAGQVTLDQQVRGADGALRWVRITARAIDREEPWKGEVWVVEDLERSRQAEAALGRLAEDLAEAQRVGHLGSWSRNFVTGEVIYSSEQFRLLGLEPSSPTPRSVEDFIALLHPDDRPGMADAYRRLRDSGEPVDVEFRVPLPEGGERWVHAAMRAERDAAGSVVRAFGINQDITARRQAEEALRRSEAQLRRILESMPVMLDAFDDQGNIVLWNQECERVTGYSAAEIVGNPRAMELLYPDTGYRERMLAEWKVRGHDYRDWEWTLTAKDGTARHVIWSNRSRVHPVSGWATWGTGVDITKRRRAEQLLEESEKRFRALIDVAADGIFIADLDGNIIDFNTAACDSLGYSCEELVGMNVLDLDQKAKEIGIEELRRLHRQAVERTLVWEGMHRRKDGSTFPVQVRISGVRIGERVFVVGIARDMTEQKRAEEALRQSEARFRVVVENSADFIALLARDGRIQFVGPAVRELLGFDPGEIVGHPYLDFVAPGDEGRATGVFLDLLANPGSERRVRLAVRLKGGGRREFDFVARNLLEVPAVGGILVAGQAVGA